MELLQLRYFLDSAKTESFAKTAQKYMVPATSVSSAVKRLEKELGCTLFHRTCNRIMLNENGKNFKASLTVVFDELDCAVGRLSTESVDTREIKVLVRAVRSKFTDYIIEYKEIHPRIEFKTVFDFNETDYEGYDIIIDEKSDVYQDYENFDLCSARIYMKICADSLLCDKRLTLKQLRNQPFVSMGEHSNMHRILIEECKRAGFTPKIVVQTNDIQCYSKCIVSGIGIGLGRRLSYNYFSPKIKLLDVIDFNVMQDVCCYYKKQSAYGNVEQFLKFLKSKTTDFFTSYK